MWCPKCRAEYREGFDKCADCNVDLVKKAPAESKVEYTEYECVLKTYNPADVAMIKSIFENENITYFVKGEQFTSIQPLVEPARIMVKQDQAEQAKEILKKFEVQFMGINIKTKESSET